MMVKSWILIPKNPSSLFRAKLPCFSFSTKCPAWEELQYMNNKSWLPETVQKLLDDKEGSLSGPATHCAHGYVLSSSNRGAA
jgi:hypothetical protein